MDHEPAAGVISVVNGGRGRSIEIRVPEDIRRENPVSNGRVRLKNRNNRSFLTEVLLMSMSLEPFAYTAITRITCTTDFVYLNGL